MKSLFLKYIWLFMLFFFTNSCGQKQNRNVKFFKGTKAYDLAVAVEKEDLINIEKLVKKDATLLEYSNPVSGSNVLELAVHLENYNAFNKLLEVGANPNYINPITKKSILINSIKFYYKPKAYKIDRRYPELLLKYGANPNYVIERNFTDKKGHYHLATSPLMEASKLDLSLVKLLLKYGADPHKKIEEDLSTPFTSAFMGFKNKFEIINYYIDTLKVDVHQPLKKISKDKYLYVQDFIKKYLSYKKNTKGFYEQKKLINKLTKMGVEFKNYNYKL